MNRINKCDLCGNKEFEFLFKCHDRQYRINTEYSLNKCKNCGLIFINPQPNGAELEKHYPSGEYYSLKNKDPSKFTKLIYRTIYLKNSNLFLKLLFLPIKPLLRTIKIVRDGKLLDVGCGSGQFLTYLTESEMSCFGIEPWGFNKEFAQKNNLKIIKNTLKKAKFKNSFFDVITINHVFEHINNPTETLKEIYRILKPGGFVVLGVPVYDCLAYKIFGKYWSQLDVPRHLFDYSTKNLKEYAKKTGFDVKQIRYNSRPFQILGSLFYWLNRNKNKYLSDKNFVNNTILSIVSLPFVYLLNFFKIGDQIELILKKN